MPSDHHTNIDADLVVTPLGDGRVGVVQAVDARGNLMTEQIACALGRGGVVVDKREGDGATPIGRFPLRRCFFRPDRGAAPTTGLSVEPIRPDDGWGDDPSDPEHYNRPVRLPHASGHERMHREDELYDVVVVLGHNDAPPVPGAGSAIFMHVARPDYSPTEGCIALTNQDLRVLLRYCGPDSSVVVWPASPGESLGEL